MSCDFCGKVKPELHRVNDIVESDHVKYICENCRKKIDKKITFFRSKMFRKRLKLWLERNRKK